MAKLYVVRHADAVVRGRSDEPDELRTLTERGRQQAEGLCERLADAGIARMVASPFRRCVETCEPLAARMGLQVEIDHRLAEGQSWHGVLDLATEIGESAVAFCSHGDVIPDLLDALLQRGIELKQEPRWPKASTWVLTRDGDGFSKGEYLPPPR